MKSWKERIAESPETLHHIIIYIEVIVLTLLLVSLFLITPGGKFSFPASNQDGKAKAMQEAFRYDVNTCQSSPHLNWVDLLSYLGTRYGGDFSKYSTKDLDALAEQLLSGKTLEELTANMKYYTYYRQAYGAVLDGLVGQYDIQIAAENAPLFATPAVNSDGTTDPDRVWVTKYGLKAFSPIAKGFPYQDYDDFGVSRSYGYKRQHLGHDMMGQVGDSVSAALTESGTTITRTYGKIIPTINPSSREASSQPAMSSAIWEEPVTAGQRTPIISMRSTCISASSLFLMSLRKKETTRSGWTATNSQSFCP